MRAADQDGERGGQLRVAAGVARRPAARATTAVMIAQVDSGPTDSWREEPMNAYRARDGMAAHRPATGGGRQHPVRHHLRDEVGSDGEPGEDVPSQPRPFVAAQLLQAGQEAVPSRTPGGRRGICDARRPPWSGQAPAYGAGRSCAPGPRRYGHLRADAVRCVRGDRRPPGTVPEGVRPASPPYPVLGAGRAARRYRAVQVRIRRRGTYKVDSARVSHVDLKTHEPGAPGDAPQCDGAGEAGPGQALPAFVVRPFEVATGRASPT